MLSLLLSIVVTIICEEYPDNYQEGKEKYYPINIKDNENLYNIYMNDIYKNYPNIILCGRLGKYRYFDMDDAIKNAIIISENFLKQRI